MEHCQWLGVRGGGESRGYPCKNWSFLRVGTSSGSSLPLRLLAGVAQARFMCVGAKPGCEAKSQKVDSPFYLLPCR